MLSLVALLAFSLPTAACAALVGADFSGFSTSVDGPEASAISMVDAGDPAIVVAEAGTADAATAAVDATAPATATDGAVTDDGTAPACDPATCEGCCNGNTCEVGTKPDACGAVGGTCSTCASGSTCYARACTPVFLACQQFLAGATPHSCDEICPKVGLTCSRGCWADNPTAVGQVQPDNVCVVEDGAVTTGSCSDVLPIATGDLLGCCCR